MQPWTDLDTAIPTMNPHLIYLVNNSVTFLKTKNASACAAAPASPSESPRREPTPPPLLFFWRPSVESTGRQSRRPPVRCCIPANPVCTLVPGSLQGKWYRSGFVLTDMGVELVHLQFRNGSSFCRTEEASVAMKERLLNTRRFY